MTINNTSKKFFVILCAVLQSIIGGCSGYNRNNFMHEQEIEFHTEGPSQTELNGANKYLEQNDSMPKSAPKKTSKRKIGACAILMVLLLGGAITGALFGGKEWGASSTTNKVVTTINTNLQNIGAVIPNCTENSGFLFIDEPVNDTLNLDEYYRCSKCPEGAWPDNEATTCSNLFPGTNCETPEDLSTGNSEIKCSTCNSGYLKTDNGECMPMINVYNELSSSNCQSVSLSMQGAIQCTNCTQGYYPSGNTCIETVPIIDNCASVENNQYGNGLTPICSSCDSGYNPTPLKDSCIANEALVYTISPGDVIQNCGELGFTGTFAGINGTNNVCVTCNYGYVPSSNGQECTDITTISLPTGCQTILNNLNGNSNILCGTCEPGYYLQGGECESLSQVASDIGTYNPNISNCQIQMYFIGVQPSGSGIRFFPSNCYQCDYTNRYYNNQGSCSLTNPFTIANCLNYNNNGLMNDGCTLCAAGYSLNTTLGECVTDASIVQGIIGTMPTDCLEISLSNYINVEGCSLCATGTWPTLNGTECTNATQTLTGCQTILDNLNGNSNILCGTCEPGYYLQGNTCQPVLSVAGSIGAYNENLYNCTSQMFYINNFDSSTNTANLSPRGCYQCDFINNFYNNQGSCSLTNPFVISNCNSYSNAGLMTDGCNQCNGGYILDSYAGECIIQENVVQSIVGTMEGCENLILNTSYQKAGCYKCNATGGYYNNDNQFCTTNSTGLYPAYCITVDNTGFSPLVCQSCELGMSPFSYGCVNAFCVEGLVGCNGSDYALCNSCLSGYDYVETCSNSGGYSSGFCRSTNNSVLNSTLCPGIL